MTKILLLKLDLGYTKTITFLPDFLTRLLNIYSFSEMVCSFPKGKKENLLIKASEF